MMTSGEHLPQQVKAIVEDSGYSSIEDELAYELKQRFKMPKQPLITTASWFTEAKAGFDFKRGSSVKQLKKISSPFFSFMEELINLCRLRWCIKTIAQP
ncbi:hydrolase [Liquorilactobacillus sucicola DSM 21376 = JCM 15457]|nr:hydrolase [Liquorilactobacillus sucicola DSM 21376 = JCM 15457]